MDQIIDQMDQEIDGIDAYLTARGMVLEMINIVHTSIPIMFNQKNNLDQDPSASDDEKDEALEVIRALLDLSYELQELFGIINQTIFKEMGQLQQYVLNIITMQDF
jgi:hypothetical protein